MPKTDIKLKPQHEMFCQYYTGAPETFGNAVQSYAKAYNKDVTIHSEYSSCRTAGNRLLTNDDITARINELLDEIILNDATVDSELGWLIKQREDRSAKVQAIREYNKLKGRITDKHEVNINPIEEIIKKYGGGEGAGINELPTTEAGPSSDTA